MQLAHGACDLGLGLHAGNVGPAARLFELGALAFVRARLALGTALGTKLGVPRDDEPEAELRALGLHGPQRRREQRQVATATRRLDARRGIRRRPVSSVAHTSTRPAKRSTTSSRNRSSLSSARNELQAGRSREQPSAIEAVDVAQRAGHVDRLERPQGVGSLFDERQQEFVGHGMCAICDSIMARS